ncbi:DNA repair protein RecO [bacterium]|nr:DNA repair protein RecO [bacterium]
MPKLHKSNALILKRIRHGDTSLILHAFTRDHGRVPFIAKGARSGGKRPPVPLVPVVELEFIWATSTRSELQLLREWSLVDGFGPVHADFTRLAWAQAGIEVLGRTLSGEEEHRDLFDLTLTYLHALGEASARYENLFILFRLLALRELGYELSVDANSDSTQPLVFIPGQGLISAKQVDSSRDKGMRIAPGSIKSLEMLLKQGFDNATRFKLTRDAHEEIDRLLNAAYRFSFDRWGKLESLKLLTPYTEPAPQGGGNHETRTT